MEGKRNMKKHQGSYFNEIVRKNGGIRRTVNVETKGTWGHKRQEVVDNYHCTHTELIMTSY